MVAACIFLLYEHVHKMRIWLECNVWLFHYNTALIIARMMRSITCRQHIEAETKWTPLPDDIFKCISLNENVWILLTIQLRFVPKGPINNIPALVQIMAWRRPGDKPLSEPSMISLLTHICVTRPQCVKIATSDRESWVPLDHVPNTLLVVELLLHIACVMAQGLYFTM